MSQKPTPEDMNRIREAFDAYIDEQIRPASAARLTEPSTEEVLDGPIVRAFNHALAGRRLDVPGTTGISAMAGLRPRS